MNKPLVCFGILSDVKSMISIPPHPVNEKRTGEDYT